MSRAIIDRHLLFDIQPKVIIIHSHYPPMLVMNTTSYLTTHVQWTYHSTGKEKKYYLTIFLTVWNLQIWLRGYERCFWNFSGNLPGSYPGRSHLDTNLLRRMALVVNPIWKFCSWPTIRARYAGCICGATAEYHEKWIEFCKFLLLL